MSSNMDIVDLTSFYEAYRKLNPIHKVTPRITQSSLEDDIAPILGRHSVPQSSPERAQSSKVETELVDEEIKYEKIAALILLEEFLEGFKGKNILDVGCGDGILSDYDFYPEIGKIICSKGGIVYGLDKEFIRKDDPYLKRFKEETGIIPIRGRIENIGEVLNKEFDGVISTAVMGRPTKDLNWMEGMKKLYSLTKKGGYHCHYKFSNEDFFNVSKEKLEEIGFNVLKYFEYGGKGSTLALKKT